MTKLYKLTDAWDRTYGECQWGENVEHTASGEGELCGPGWLHAYIDPLLAILLNRIHGNFHNPQLWEAEGDVGKTDRDLKVGCTRLKTIRRIPCPEITRTQRIRFAILCAKAVCTLPVFVEWANNWLSGKDRGHIAAAEVSTTINIGTAAVCAAKAAAETVAYVDYSAAWAAVYATIIDDAITPSLVALAQEAMEEE